MPIPYMGSKRKSAQKIYQAISNLNPDSNLLVDLFCGGFAVGEKFMRNNWPVIANDKNKYVVELIREAIAGRFNDDVFTPEFITRDKFVDVINNPDKYDDYYVGYVQCIWSFGNSQQDYMFGKDVEPTKLAGHILVIDKDPSGVEGFIPKPYIEAVLKQSDWHKSRIALNKVAGKLKNRIYELQQLQQLERLEQLQQLERLEQLQQLELYSKSYDEIVIPNQAIVYCDPPYQGTTEYKEGGFNHDKFWQWAREIAKTNKIYISEYKAPDDFVIIRSWPQKSTLQGGVQKHSNQPDECIFAPKGQEVTNG